VSVDVSVVIPFFNPGADIEDCLGSMVDQTLDHERFEVLLVDDGSTDGSDERVAAWVRRYPQLMSLRRIAPSGGPARPRNLGVDDARGRYVQFVDADDTLAPRALERLVEIADESDADIVVHKISAGGPRNIYHRLFRRTETRLTFADCLPLIRNGTVCKMFRRSFLREHDVRFPEGDTFVEDQHLCLRSYAHARSIAIFSDLVCYFHWRRRTGGEHFGDVDVDPVSYRAELAALLDVVDAEVTPAEARIAAARRYYRGEVLGRLRARAMLGYDDTYRRALVGQLRELAVERISPEVHDGLTALIRIQSALLLRGDVDGLLAFSQRLDKLRLDATAGDPRWRDGRLVIDVTGWLRYGEDDFRFERHGDGWAMPAAMAPGIDAADRLWTEADDDDLDLDLASIARQDSSLWSTIDGLAMTVDETGKPTFAGEVVIDPRTVAGGSPLTTGVWDLRLRIYFSGLPRATALVPAGRQPLAAGTWVSGDDGSTATVFWTRRSQQLALDVDGWMHSLQNLIDDPLDCQVESDQAARLVISATQIKGPAGDVRPAAIILAPVGGGPPLTLDAQLALDPSGSTIHAPLPPLLAGSRHRVWLRTAELGGPAPRQLPVIMAIDASGAVATQIAPD
jgi:glycosyltransferase involved in cell wall biosynthesis